MSRQIVLLILFVVVASALLFVPLPIATNYAGRTIENAGHMPLFFVGTLFVLSILRRNPAMHGARAYLLAGLIGAGAGFLSEVLQKPLRRDASWEDVFADVLGVVCALALYAAFAPRARARPAVRVAALLVGLGCVGIYLAPIFNMTRAYIYRDEQFPVLASFRSGTELFWILDYGVKHEIRAGALDVEFEADLFPGVAFHEPVPDWRRFKTLAIDLENPEEEPLNLTVRVHDIGHGRDFSDRYNRSFTFAPGERRTLRIALEDVRRAPRNRLMNMAQISNVTVFRSNNDGSKRMRLYGMRLE